MMIYDDICLEACVCECVWVGWMGHMKKSRLLAQEHRNSRPGVFLEWNWRVYLRFGMLNHLSTAWNWKGPERNVGRLTSNHWLPKNLHHNEASTSIIQEHFHWLSLTCLCILFLQLTPILATIYWGRMSPSDKNELWASDPFTVGDSTGEPPKKNVTYEAGF